MWTVILIIIVVILVKFFYDRNQQSQKISKEGGMDIKYRELISIILSGDNRAKIHQLTSESVIVGSSNIGGSTIFILTQTFGKLTIQWKMENPVFGKHKLEWTFPEYADQTKMFELMMNDLAKYQNNVMSSKGFPDMLAENESEKLDEVQDILNSNIDFKTGMKGKNKNEIEKVLKGMDEKNIMKLFEGYVYADKQAELYRLKAIDKIYAKDKDYKGALELINKALEFNEKDYEPSLYELRAECQANQMNYSLALDDMNKAIKSLQENTPYEYYNLCDFFKTRAEIKRKLKDIKGAQEDKRIANEYEIKYEANNQINKQENEDDLPF